MPALSRRKGQRRGWGVLGWACRQRCARQGHPCVGVFKCSPSKFVTPNSVNMHAIQLHGPQVDLPGHGLRSTSDQSVAS
eukprot:365023-Chlamydomonas_euryale.AAC.9